MNLFDIPEHLPEGEFEEVLYENGGTRVCRIISRGQASPPGFFYDQAENEWLTVISGTAGISYHDGRSVSLCAGDTLFLPAHNLHRVDYTSFQPPCIWICVYNAV